MSRHTVSHPTRTFHRPRVFALNVPGTSRHLDDLDRQITLLGTGGLLTMLTESSCGTLAGRWKLGLSWEWRMDQPGWRVRRDKR